MTVPRLFVSNSLGEAGAEIALSAAQSHYLLNVLRLSEGSEIFWPSMARMENGAQRSSMPGRRVAA